METIIQTLLYLHILAGSLSLISGLLAIASAKGKRWHRKAGKIYFYAMTGVFITGIAIAGYQLNRFLFLIAFLSYYSVFCGVRILKLKRIHQQQKPEWYDWGAGILNAVANLIFILLGVKYALEYGISAASAWLSIGFGTGGMLISYINLRPFVIKPEKPYHWILSHNGNMMGGFIATCTAFTSTLVTRFDLMNPYVAFVLPSIIGIPLLMFWQQRTKKQFEPGERSFSQTNH